MKNLMKLLIATALLIVGLQANATIVIDPAITTILDSGNQTSTSVIDAYVESTYSVTELYKSDAGASSGSGSDSGSFAGSYDTVFSNSATDPQDALLTYVSGATISCPDCYLLVKDGNQDPSWYLFDIGGWDGVETIDMQNFWPNQGAISHVTIYSNGSGVPAPAPLIVMAIGLVGMLGLRRMKNVI